MKPKTKSPSKNRKRRYSAPNHRRKKFFQAKLIDDLRAEHGIRRMSIREGDHVLVIRGEFKDVEGKVSKIDRKNIRLYIEGVQIEKTGGASYDYAIRPSDVVISKINLKKDKYRKKIIDRKEKIEFE
ncbi:MAG: 50S ribosomal protein L24 [Promethearchaeota archaeon]|nr:MAG: 50S ribosomal protein L24 [Candidatus Lokiarchaeota archaeon]